MKNKRIFLILPLLLLSGCKRNKSSQISQDSQVSQDSGDSQQIVETSMSLIADFVFDHMYMDEEPLATLLFEDSYYTFSGEIKFGIPLVAGDQLNVTFNGEHEIYCQLTSPGHCYVSGEIKDYQLIKAEIIGFHVDDATIGEVADQIRESYKIPGHGNVIVDNIGRFVSLDDYEGHDLYLSVNRKYSDARCGCPIGAECEACPMFVWGLYAFNPREG